MDMISPCDASQYNGADDDELAVVLHGQFDPLAADESDDLLERIDQLWPGPPMWLRKLTAVIGGLHLVTVLPWLVDRDPFGLLGASSGAHLTRDGALGLVVSTAAILVAWRPRWALPCFAIGSVAVVAQAVAGVLDDTIVNVGSNELVHVPSAVLACLIWLCANRLEALAPARR